MHAIQEGLEGAYVECRTWGVGCELTPHTRQVFLSSFYFNNSSKILRSDYTRYMILAYITLFRMEEMGMKRFKCVVCSVRRQEVVGRRLTRAPMCPCAGTS